MTRNPFHDLAVHREQVRTRLRNIGVPLVKLGNAEVRIALQVQKTRV